MNTKCLSSLAIVAIFLVPAMTFASTVDAEKKVFAELTALIPQDRIVEIEDLHEKWKEVQKGKSDAIILDIRTGAEFHAGHLKDSNTIDSGNPYLVPKTWPDPNTEIWIFCRSQHRATYFVSFLYRYGYRNVYLVHGGIAAWAEKGYPLFSKDFGEIKVIKYDKALKEEFKTRQFD